MDIKEIALRVAEEMPSEFLWYEGCGYEAGILPEEAVEFAEALIESHKAELLKEAGEPVGYHYLPNNEMFPVEEVSRSNLKNNPQDYVFLYTSDQLAAAILKATKQLEKEIERLKTVPMKYRRMAFNAQLQDENNELRAQLAASQEETGLLTERNATNEEYAANLVKALTKTQDQLAKAEQRVAEACVLLCMDAVTKSKSSLFRSGAIIVAGEIRDGEWRKFVKGVR